MVNCQEIAKKIYKDFLVYEEGDYIYFLDPNLKEGTLILEIMGDKCLIVWSNEIKSKTLQEICKIIMENLHMPLIFPYINDIKEYEELVSLGAKPFDFDKYYMSNNDTSSKTDNRYGSLILD